MTLAKRCSVCGRFRPYDQDDRFCVICGNEALEPECPCGRNYDYALDESNQGASLHCPRCGKVLRGRTSDYE